jgi:ubiquinone/menaquinone biosynthesis C-methylase UbiE
MLDAMQLHPGDLVVDLCCGSGQNFADLQRRVGPYGRIIGVDISAGMLDVASVLVARKRWENFDLVQANIFDDNLPDNTSAAPSTLASISFRTSK